jgi:adenosylcobinamide-GDP ribazoletransferase
LGHLSSLKSLIAFLTIIPVAKAPEDVSELGKIWFLSPLLGAFIGALVGTVTWLSSKILPSLVVGPLAIGLIVLVTGAHHFDGLLDFGDALMVRGSSERKIEVMHDKSLGAGGFALAFFVSILAIASVWTLAPNLIFQALVISEMSAKLSMVLASRLGRSAHEGTGTIVVNAMHGKNANTKTLIASTVSLVIAGFILGYRGVAATLSSMVCAALMTAVSHNQFKGVTGDVFGAINETSRMLALIVLAVVIR